MRWLCVFVLAVFIAQTGYSQRLASRHAPRRAVAPALFDQRLASLGDPTVTANRAIVMDAATGQVLWSRNADVVGYPASTTKILTALIMAETTKPDDIITIPVEASKVGEASLHVIPGEQISADSLLTAILLRSANDACVAAAIHISGSVEKFAQRMNERARQLGCRSSNFVNPNGLHHPKHVTTAHDLALIAQAGLKNEWVRSIAKVKTKKITRSLLTTDTVMTSKNALIPADPTCIGFKTGFTNPAGSCFVGAFERLGTTIITVSLGSAQWPPDHKAMAAYADANFEREQWVQEGEEVTKLTMQTTGESIPVVAKSSGNVLRKRGDRVPNRQVTTQPGLVSVDAGQVVGSATLDLPGSPKVDLVAKFGSQTRPKSSSTPSAWLIPAGVVLVGGAALIGRRRRRG